MIHSVLNREVYKKGRIGNTHISYDKQLDLWLQKLQYSIVFNACLMWRIYGPKQAWQISWQTGKKKHESLKAHIKNTLILSLFGKFNIARQTANTKKSVYRHNKKVKYNRRLKYHHKLYKILWSIWIGAKRTWGNWILN